MSDSQPSSNLDLEQLRKQAKDLLKTFRADDPLARKRVSMHLPQLARPVGPHRDSRSLLLADALFVIARENGFASWPKLTLAIAGGTGERSTSSIGGAKGRGGGWRRQFMTNLASTIVTLAEEGKIESFVDAISGLPLRDFLWLRENLQTQGGLDIVVGVLIAGLSHPRPKVRYECAHALDHYADDRCVEPLRRLLNDPVPRVRRIALHALSCETCKIAPLDTNDDILALAIDRALNDPSINVRRHAVAELGGRSRDERTARALQTLLQRETDVTLLRHARRALRRLSAGEDRPEETNASGPRLALFESGQPARARHMDEALDGFGGCLSFLTTCRQSW